MALLICRCPERKSIISAPKVFARLLFCILPPDSPPVFLLEEDARVLSALLSLSPDVIPSSMEIYEAARYPRVVYFRGAGGGYSVSLDGVEITSGKLEELLLRVVALLEPREGEVLSLYYGRLVKLPRVKTGLRLIKKEYPFLEAAAYFGGQEGPLIVSLE